MFPLLSICGFVGCIMPAMASSEQDPSGLKRPGLALPQQAASCLQIFQENMRRFFASRTAAIVNGNTHYRSRARNAHERLAH